MYCGARPSHQMVDQKLIVEQASSTHLKKIRPSHPHPLTISLSLYISNLRIGGWWRRLSVLSSVLSQGFDLAWVKIRTFTVDRNQLPIHIHSLLNWKTERNLPE